MKPTEIAELLEMLAGYVNPVGKASSERAALSKKARTLAAALRKNAEPVAYALRGTNRPYKIDADGHVITYRQIDVDDEKESLAERFRESCVPLYALPDVEVEP